MVKFLNNSVWVFCLVALLSFNACVGYKDLVMFQEAPGFGTLTAVPTPDMDSSAVDSINKLYNLTEYKVRPQDNLYIKVNEFKDDITRLINGSSQEINFLGEEQLFIQSFTVNDRGTITMPLIGELYVKGKTTLEIQTEIDSLLLKFTKLSSSTVKLANFRVSILGEVVSPGTRLNYNNKVTLLQAIGLAGGFTDYANLRKVRLMRETETGVETKFIDFTRADVMRTPDFYIRPNDVIYVEPLKQKTFQINSGPFNILLTTLSVGAVLVNILLTVNK